MTSIVAAFFAPLCVSLAYFTVHCSVTGNELRPATQGVAGVEKFQKRPRFSSSHDAATFLSRTVRKRDNRIHGQ